MIGPEKASFQTADHENVGTFASHADSTFQCAKGGLLQQTQSVPRLFAMCQNGFENKIWMLTSKLDQNLLTEVRGERRLSIPTPFAKPSASDHCLSFQFQLIRSAGMVSNASFW